MVLSILYIANIVAELSTMDYRSPIQSLSDVESNDAFRLLVTKGGCTQTMVGKGKSKLFKKLREKKSEANADICYF